MSAYSGSVAEHVSTGLLSRELERILSRDRASRVTIAELGRTPIPQGSSFAIEDLVVRLDDGSTVSMVFKDFGPGRMLDHQSRIRPGFLRHPAREIRVYQSLLAGAGLGTAACLGAVADPDRDRYWLFLERVDGVELYQVGELEAWRRAARSLAAIHRTFADRTQKLQRLRCLVKYEPAFYRLWPLRACAIAGRNNSSHDLRALEWLRSRYAAVVERLASLPPTLVQGDCWASNVLVAGEAAGRVCVVDWEMAGIGPGLIDLAALTSGWGESETTSIATAYLEAMDVSSPPDAEVLADLDACRLHLALRCLGWSPHWSPPPDHARDWLREALTLAERMSI